MLYQNWRENCHHIWFAVMGSAMCEFIQSSTLGGFREFFMLST